MSTFFPTSTHASRDARTGFSVSDFSAAQKAHAYAQAESEMKLQERTGRYGMPYRQHAMESPAVGHDMNAMPDEPLSASGSGSYRRAWAAGIVFFTTVFASMAAAATVAGSDFPLMIVGL